jgi:hypothetical protein
MNPAVQQKQVIGLSDEDYKKVWALAKRCGRRGIKLTGKQGPVRFYIRDEVLYGLTAVGEQEVMNVSKVSQVNREAQYDDWLTKVGAKIKADHPDKTDEQIRAEVDVLVEANNTIKRLIADGMDCDTAFRIVREALCGDKVEEEKFLEMVGAK